MSARRRISLSSSSHSLRGTPPFSKSVRAYSRRWSKKRMLSSCCSSGLISASMNSSRSFSSCWMSCGISKSMGGSPFVLRLGHLVRAGDAHLVHDCLPEMRQQPVLGFAVEVALADPLRQLGVPFVQPSRDRRRFERHFFGAEQAVEALPFRALNPSSISISRLMMPIEFAATWNWKRSQRSRAFSARSRMKSRARRAARSGRPILHRQLSPALR